MAEDARDDEAAEAQHAVEHLRPVPDRVVKASPQLAVADAERLGQPIDPAPIEAEAPGGREDERIELRRLKPERDQPLEQVECRLLSNRLAEPFLELGRARPQQVLERDTRVVDHLAGRHPQHRAGNPGAQPQPEDQLPRLQPIRPGGPVEAGQGQLPIAPNEVDTAVGQDQR